MVAVPVCDKQAREFCRAYFSKFILALCSLATVDKNMLVEEREQNRGVITQLSGNCISGAEKGKCHGIHGYKSAGAFI